MGTYLLGMGIAGKARMLPNFHAYLKLTGALVLVPLLYIEHFHGIPLVMNAMTLFTADQGFQVAILYVFYELLAGIVSLMMLSPLVEIFDR